MFVKKRGDEKGAPHLFNLTGINKGLRDLYNFIQNVFMIIHGMYRRSDIIIITIEKD